MKTVFPKVLTSTVVAAAVFAVSPVCAQTAPERSVDQYTCKEVMRDASGGRDVAIAFLHGFFVAKSGNMKINLDVLSKQTDAFIDRCLDNPTEKAMDAMAKVKSQK